VAFGRRPGDAAWSPLRCDVGVAACGVLATSRWLPATNPTVLAALAINRYDYRSEVDAGHHGGVTPPAMPWLLLLFPGTQSPASCWRISPLPS
jgi:hypothetical protein